MNRIDIYNIITGGEKKEMGNRVWWPTTTITAQFSKSTCIGIWANKLVNTS